MQSSKFFVENAPEEEGTQLCLSHSLAREQAEQLADRFFTADYSSDGPDDNVFVNCEKSQRDSVVRLLNFFGYAERKA